MIDVIVDTLLDSIKLIPFLFLTYLVMEYLEHRTGNKTREWIQKGGKFGPLLGGILGVVPQCGFSAAAANLFTGRVITLGTLIAIYLSTSDEMLPVLISEAVPVPAILKILLIKVVVGMVMGFAIDFFLPGPKEDNDHTHDICEHDHCHCQEGTGVFQAALYHTLKITFFIIIISFALNTLLYVVGEEALGNLLLNRPVIGQLLSGIVGLIPNCAASVVITQLYLENAMSFGAMMSGLLVGTGIGILVLFKVNHNTKENIKIISLVYGIGVIVGIIIELLQITV